METMTQPTSETKATQFARFLRFFIDALALVFDQLGAKECLTAVEKKTEKLAVYISLAITALQTDQELALIDKRVQTESTPLIRYTARFTYHGRSGKFVGTNFFKKDNPDGVKFSGFGSNYTKNFGNKVENNVPAGELKAHTLLRGSKDPSIIVALGDSHETYLADLYTLLLEQKNGEEGLLLTNGYANIFYIRDVSGVLWAVFAYWDGGGWDVDAGSVGDPRAWSADYRVFCR